MKVEANKTPYLVFSEYYDMHIINVHQLDTLRKHAEEIDALREHAEENEKRGKIVSVHQIVMSDGKLSLKEVESIDDLLASGRVECSEHEAYTVD